MPNLLPFVISGLSTGAIYVLSGVGLVVLYRSSGVLNFGGVVVIRPPDRAATGV
jgi:branched-subunit amino acid ABC-type transport system permease component